MDYTESMTTKELKAWRKKKGYSQSHLAKVLDVTTQTISRWERGTRTIPHFLHLALRCIEIEGGEKVTRATKNGKERGTK